jgi:hypothetical protein
MPCSLALGRSAGGPLLSGMAFILEPVQRLFLGNHRDGPILSIQGVLDGDHCQRNMVNLVRS